MRTNLMTNPLLEMQVSSLYALATFPTTGLNHFCIHNYLNLEPRGSWTLKQSHVHIARKTDRRTNRPIELQTRFLVDYSQTADLQSNP